MDAAAELRAEDVVDELVLLDARKSCKSGRNDLGAEVVTVAGYHGLRAGNTSFDALLDLLRIHPWCVVRVHFCQGYWALHFVK